MSNYINENGFQSNLIIVHEPTFYSHQDETKSLGNDPVFEDKLKYINENKLIIWRFHDHWHRTSADGIYVGMIEKLGWKHNQTDSSMLRFRIKIKPSSFWAMLFQKQPEWTTVHVGLRYLFHKILKFNILKAGQALRLIEKY